MRLTVVVQGRDGEAAIRPQFDRDLGPARPQVPHQALEDAEGAPTGVAGARPQHGGDELARLPVEDQQRVVHVLAIIAMVGHAFLPAVGRIVRAIKVEHDVRGHTIALPLLQVEPDQRHRQAVARLGIDGILQAGEGGLAGQVRLLGQASADQLEERIGAQGVGIILILVATGDLEDALAHQRLQRVTDRATAPLGDVRGQSGTQAERGIGLREPAQTAIAGELWPIEARLHRRGGQGKVDRLDHEASPWGGWWFDTSAYPVVRCLALSTLA